MTSILASKTTYIFGAKRAIARKLRDNKINWNFIPLDCLMAPFMLSDGGFYFLKNPREISKEIA